MHISLSPDFTQLIKLVDLGVLNLYRAILAGSRFVNLTAAATATCPGTHPTVKFPDKQTKLFVAQLAVLLVLRRSELACLGLD